jgi:NADPH:quinone reductase-like Zn-dependent oxidoreductase
MRAYVIPAGSSGIDALKRLDLPDPGRPAGRQVLVRIRAASLNYRDHAIVCGNYHMGPLHRDLIPLSDGAGEVVAVGEKVSGLVPGDRVMNSFTQPPLDGSAGSYEMLGAPRDGVLCEQVLFDEAGLLKIPEPFGYEEAACFPCAGVTAWSAMFTRGEPVRPGQTLLTLGTGGVSIFALQLAKLVGARAIVTSSSDEKLERARELGADETINYSDMPEWQQEVLRLTGGAGVDCVIEVGGVGTLGRSFEAVGQRGKVMLIGVLTSGTPPSPHILMMKLAALHGIRLGDHDLARQQALAEAYRAGGIRPVIGRRFAFEEALEAFRAQAAGDFVGKIVIEV